jgi:hypothetical protein
MKKILTLLFVLTFVYVNINAQPDQKYNKENISVDNLLLKVFGGNDTTLYYGYGNNVAVLKALPSGGMQPYSYLWSTGATTQNINVSPLSTTHYTVTVTDLQKNSVVDYVTVNVVNVQCGNNNDKVLVCHNGHTICIAPSAVPAHLAQGAYLGPCANCEWNPENQNNLKSELIQNYPNPFNPVTNIKYQIGENSFVTLKIFDVLGREVAVLVNENLKAGQYQVDWNAGDYPSGVYFYRLSAGNYTEMRRMILIK